MTPEEAREYFAAPSSYVCKQKIRRASVFQYRGDVVFLVIFFFGILCCSQQIQDPWSVGAYPLGASMARCCTLVVQIFAWKLLKKKTETPLLIAHTIIFFLSMANFTIFFIVMASIEDHGLIIDIVACLLYSHFVYSLSWCMYCYIFTSQPLIDDYLEEIKEIKRSFLEHMERRNKKLHHV